MIRWRGITIEWLLRSWRHHYHSAASPGPRRARSPASQSHRDVSERGLSTHAHAQPGRSPGRKHVQNWCRSRGTQQAPPPRRQAQHEAAWPNTRPATLAYQPAAGRRQQRQHLKHAAAPPAPAPTLEYKTIHHYTNAAAPTLGQRRGPAARAASHAAGGPPGLPAATTLTMQQTALHAGRHA
jgi:hypothetical protein